MIPMPEKLQQALAFEGEVHWGSRDAVRKIAALALEGAIQAIQRGEWRVSAVGTGTPDPSTQTMFGIQFAVDRSVGTLSALAAQIRGGGA